MIKKYESEVPSKRNYSEPKYGEAYFHVGFLGDGTSLKIPSATPTPNPSSTGFYNLKVGLNSIANQGFNTQNFTPLLINPQTATEITTINESLVEVDAEGANITLKEGYIYKVYFQIFWKGLTDYGSATGTATYTLGNNATGLPSIDLSVGSSTLGAKNSGVSDTFIEVFQGFPSKGVLAAKDSPLVLTPLFKTDGDGMPQNEVNGWSLDPENSFLNVEMQAEI